MALVPANFREIFMKNKLTLLSIFMLLGAQAACPMQKETKTTTGSRTTTIEKLLTPTYFFANNSDVSWFVPTHFFANNPDVSWNDFKGSFKQKYSHLNIPTIVVTPYEHPEIQDLIRSSPAAYHLKQQTIIVNSEIIKKNAYSLEALEFMLLHEIGHHNFGQAKRDANLLRGESALTTKPQFCERAEQGLSSLQKSLMATNAYQIFRYRPNIKLLTAQALATTAYNYIPTATKVIQEKNAHYERFRSEEIFADDFAAKHANKKALQAFNNEVLSSQAAFNAQKSVHHDIYNQAMDDITYANPMHRRLASTILSLAIGADQVFEKIKYSSPTLHTFFDPAHPSHKERFDMINRVIKDRF